MVEDLRKSGIQIIGDVPWGTHFCQFYETGEDLIDILVPYFKTGLENNEFCMWITAYPVSESDAERALRRVLPDVDRYLQTGQLEIMPHVDWYLKGGSFDSDRVLQGWVDKLNGATAKGFDGLRLTGNTFWLEKSGWRDFTAYEAAVDSVIGRYRIIAVCTYAADKCGVAEVADVISNHRFALVKRHGGWETIESSERKRIEAALAETEAKYRLLFENMPDGFAYHKVIYDEVGKPVDYVFLEANRAFERQTGLRRSEITGRRITEALPGIEKSDFDWIGTYGRIASTGEEARFEQFAAPLGRWYSVSAYSPEREHFVAIFTDVTERKRAEDALRESEERFRRIVETAEEGIWAIDAEGKTIFANNKIASMLGFSVDEMLGRTLLSFMDDDGRELADAILVRRVQGSEGQHDFKFKRRDGSDLWAIVAATPVIDLGGNYGGALAMITDITSRKHNEDEIKRLNEALERRAIELNSINQELEAFTYSVSHDLQAPLRSINGFSGALMEECVENLDPQAQDYLGRVRDASLRMSQLIDDLLDLSRITRHEMRRETVDLSALAQEITSDLQKADPQRQVEVVIEPGLIAKGDRRLLRVALDNLLRNAWKFTSGHSTALVGFGCKECGGAPAFFVRDDGAGFDMAYADKLFGAFQRLHSATEFPGNGIGLATVQRVVHRHGGRIWAEAGVERGASFYFSLPSA